MPKVSFKIPSKEKIAEFIFDLKGTLNDKDTQENANPFDCIYVNLPVELIKEILLSKTLNKKLKDKIIKNIKIKKEHLSVIKKVLPKLETYWKKIDNIFFKEMEKYFGKKYLERIYLCYLTNEVVGSYFKKNEVTTPDYGLEKTSSIIAEEILHLIYWKFWEKTFNKKFDDKIYDGKIWSPWNISEIIPEYILIENPIFRKFGWNKEKREYPFINDLRKVLDPIWKNGRDMKGFLIKSQKAINKINKK